MYSINNNPEIKAMQVSKEQTFDAENQRMKNSGFHLFFNKANLQFCINPELTG